VDIDLFFNATVATSILTYRNSGTRSISSFSPHKQGCGSAQGVMKKHLLFFLLNSLSVSALLISKKGASCVRFGDRLKLRELLRLVPLASEFENH